MNAIKRILALENELRAVREELAETNRRLANIIRLGVVESAHERSVNVKTGTNLAKNVPFFVPAAGRVRHYRRPTVGEQCILINIGDGDNLNNAVSLMGLRSNQFPFPTLEENEVMTDYGGGMTELYNLDNGSITCDYPGGMFLNADLTHIGNQEHTGNTNRTGDSIFTGNLINTGAFNHQGAFAVSGGAGGGAATFSGSMEISGGDVIVDGYSVKLHYHVDSKGGNTSEAKS